MGLFSKLLKGPQPDMEKSAANEKKVRALFDQVVENGEKYRLIVGYTEDVKRFNYGFVHGSKTQIGNLIVGWNEDTKTIVAVPTVPDLSGCGDPTYYRREEILKAYRNKYPTDAFIIYPNRKEYIGINAYEWLEDESLYIYLYQKEELEAFTAFFQNEFSTKKAEREVRHTLARNWNVAPDPDCDFYLWTSVVPSGGRTSLQDQVPAEPEQGTTCLAHL